MRTSQRKTRSYSPSGTIGRRLTAAHELQLQSQRLTAELTAHRHWLCERMQRLDLDRIEQGDLVVTRADVLIDIGRSINPGIDRGQVIGGFVQGMGWVTGECLVYNERGVLLSNSPTTYKIPAASDVPADFRCEFFPNDDNVANVARSKAVGEPPLMHAIAVWSAVSSGRRGFSSKNLSAAVSGSVRSLRAAR